MSAVEHLIVLSKTYCDATGLAEATLSTRLLGDGKRLAAIRAGSDIGVRRLHRATDWFSANWPENAAWPADVPRPQDSVPDMERAS